MWVVIPSALFCFCAVLYRLLRAPVYACHAVLAAVQPFGALAGEPDIFDRAVFFAEPAPGAVVFGEKVPVQFLYVAVEVV